MSRPSSWTEDEDSAEATSQIPVKQRHCPATRHGALRHLCGSAEKSPRIKAFLPGRVAPPTLDKFDFVGSNRKLTQSKFIPKSSHGEPIQMGFSVGAECLRLCGGLPFRNTSESGPGSGRAGHFCERENSRGDRFSAVGLPV